MIYEIPNFISQQDIDYIYVELNKNIETSPEIFNKKQGSYRDGKTIFISEEPNLKNLDVFLFEKIFGSKSLLSFLHRRYYPDFETGDSGYEFHRYSSGEICHVHSDGECTFLNRTKDEEAMLRFASIVLHLNTPSSGGELVFPELNKTIKTEAGKIVIFPPYGFAQHYTRESPDNRDVIVTWFVYKNIFVKHR
jgi:hypothetical protein